MKSLQNVLYKVHLAATAGNMDIPVSAIVFDSRKVIANSLFVAVKGTVTDGHQYIQKAIELGATAILCEQLPENLQNGVTYIQTQDSAEALGIAAANFYDNPSQHIKVVAVTGTNGKTTTATLLYRLFRQLGYATGLISTVENRINDTVLPATHTTPDAVALQALLAEMKKQGCTHCFMEASSHAIHQRRIAGLQLTGAIFTNITHDHLDYHKTFDNYIAAKKMLFDYLPKSAFALTNRDDKRGMVMVQNTKATVYDYALKTPAKFKCVCLNNTIQGLQLRLNEKEVWFKITGYFNAYNLTAVWATALLLGEAEDEVLMQLSAMDEVAGRFEKIILPNQAVAVIDYAHTPDALENVLSSITEIQQSTHQAAVITVVGCGGNRDTAKRPEMAKIACKYSHQVILTSDNPREEDPEQIIEDMKEGVDILSTKKVKTIIDRKEAIKTAILAAKPYDIVLVAGKGHETYQEIKGVKYPFDDRAIVRECIPLLSSGGTKE